MANSAVRLFQAAIGTGSYTTQYTVSSGKGVLKSFDICNTSPTLIKVRLCLVPSGDSAGTANALLYDFPIPGNGVFGWEGEQVIATSGFIATQATLAGLTITASGLTIT